MEMIQFIYLKLINYNIVDNILIMEFCIDCHNILVIKININKQDTPSHYCEICDKYFDLNSPVLDSKKYTSGDTHNSNLISVLFDNTYPMVSIKCKKCDNDKIAYYKNENMQNIYLCRECLTYWDRKINNKSN